MTKMLDSAREWALFNWEHASRLSDEVDALRAEIERLRAALAWIDQQRYTDRDTINPANGYDRAIALNEKLLALMDVARAALEERT